jgi:ABC-2 type transport system permease protein
MTPVTRLADAGAAPVVAAVPAGLGPLRIPGWSGFDPSRTRGGGRGDTWRSFATAARLGWLMEANWTDPLLFFIYSVAKPVASALILVFMIQVISGAATPELRAFVVVGSALWSFVVSGIAGLAWSVLDDRERYRMLKYVYVSPSTFLVVLVGRGVARVAVGAMGATITLAVGVILLGVPFDPAHVDWPLLLIVSPIGLASIVAIGAMMAAVCLQTRLDSWTYPEALAGALFLVSGAVFPLSVLPGAIQAVGLAIPVTWWIEGTRRALFPGTPGGVGGEASTWFALSGTLAPTAAQIATALLVTGLVGTLAAAAAFHVSERRAKERGLLDQTSGS